MYLTHLFPKPYKKLAKAGVVKLIGADRVRETVADAIAIIEAAALNRTGNGEGVGLPI